MNAMAYDAPLETVKLFTRRQSRDLQQARLPTTRYTRSACQAQQVCRGTSRRRETTVAEPKEEL